MTAREMVLATGALATGAGVALGGALDITNPESVLAFKEDYAIYSAIEPILMELTSEEFIRLVSSLDRDKRIASKCIIEAAERKEINVKKKTTRPKVTASKRIPSFIPIDSAPLTEIQTSTLNQTAHCLIPDGDKCRLLRYAKPNRDRKFDACGRRK